jgi:hypothetical protein
MATSLLRPTTTVFFFQLNTCGYDLYVASSLTRGWVYRLQLLLALASAVILGSESRRTHDHILLFQTRDFPNMEGRVLVFISPRNRVVQLYPQTLDSLFVAHDSRGYDWGIRTCLHAGSHTVILNYLSLYSPGMDLTENVSSIIACTHIAGETTCPQSCSLVTAIVVSPVYTAVTWQWVCIQYYGQPYGRKVLCKYVWISHWQMDLSSIVKS